MLPVIDEKYTRTRAGFESIVLQTTSRDLRFVLLLADVQMMDVARNVLPRGQLGGIRGLITQKLNNSGTKSKGWLWIST
jgi:hypothetical protein